jgi:hypothetical protein
MEKLTRIKILKFILYSSIVFTVLILTSFIDSIQEFLNIEDKTLLWLLASQIFIILGITFELNALKKKTNTLLTQKTTFLKVILLFSGFVIGYYLHYFLISPSYPFIENHHHFMFWGILVSQLAIVFLAFALLQKSKRTEK